MIRRSVWPVVLLLAGCSASSSTAPSIRSAPVEQEHGHSHERDKMMLADAGPIHVALTAHLAKDGNELDIFLESADKNAMPHALPLASIVAKAKRVGDAVEQTLTFEPAPADERPKGEPEGKCSHFVAKAGWMTRDDILAIICEIEIDGKKHTASWTDFVPGKFAHHDDAAREPPAP